MIDELLKVVVTKAMTRPETAQLTAIFCSKFPNVLSSLKKTKSFVNDSIGVLMTQIFDSVLATPVNLQQAVNFMNLFCYLHASSIYTDREMNFQLSTILCFAVPMNNPSALPMLITFLKLNDNSIFKKKAYENLKHKVLTYLKVAQTSNKRLQIEADKTIRSIENLEKDVCLMSASDWVMSFNHSTNDTVNDNSDDEEDDQRSNSYNSLVDELIDELSSESSLTELAPAVSVAKK